MDRLNLNHFLWYRVEILIEVYSYLVQDVCNILISYQEMLRFYKFQKAEIGQMLALTTEYLLYLPL